MARHRRHALIAILIIAGCHASSRLDLRSSDGSDDRQRIKVVVRGDSNTLHIHQTIRGQDTTAIDSIPPKA